MASSSPKPAAQQATAYLPNSAYFADGQGPPCNTLRSDISGKGFTKINGPTDSQKCTILSITPPGGARIQISPPGTTPRVPYDLESTITLVGTGS